MRSIRQSETNRVNSESLIRYSYLITKDYTMISSPYWNIGDKSKPYPNDEMLNSGALANQHLDLVSTFLHYYYYWPIILLYF